MALFIDEKGDGAEADDAVVEGVWLPPWQELPMMEHNDKSAPTGKLKKYIGIYWNCFWMYLNTYILQSDIIYNQACIIVLEQVFITGNALARVQRVHKPTNLWDITFCTRWFWGF